MRLADILETQSLPIHAATVATPATQGLKVAKVAGVAAYCSKIEKAAEKACKGLSGHITQAVLLTKLSPDDVAELEACSDPLPFLRSFAIALVWATFRRDGIAPPGWDQAAHCDQCGPVLLWAQIEVAGCPWCWNRLHKVKIPRPKHYEINERSPSPTQGDAA